MEQTLSPDQRRVLARQAGMIFTSAQESVPDPNDLEDIAMTYQSLVNRIALDSP